jgi:hypothetical protein
VYYSSAISTPTLIVKICVAVIIFLLPSIAMAASLILSPRAGTYSVGSTFSTSVLVDTNGVAFNAASGRLSFPPDLLEVVSVSKASSIISLWVQEPSFSNAAGNVSFEGIVLNPGFKGSSGNIISVQFRVKKTGSANVSFTSGELLANDGIGTSILSSLGTGAYTLISRPVAPVVEDTPPTQSDDTPAESQSETKSTAKVTVASPSHPVDGWSNQTTGTFTFAFGEEVVAMRLLVDDVPDSIPVVVYEPPIKEKSLSDLAEGTSYLHIQMKDSSGWGEVKHYKLQIDTVKPEQLSVQKIVPQNDADITFALTSSDLVSGIDRYEISIDGKETIVVPATGTETFFSPRGLVAGIHTMHVKVFDKAGNVTESTQQFEIAAKQDRTETSAVWGRIVQNSNVFLIGLILLPLTLLVGGLLFLYLLTRARQQEQHILLATQAAKHDAVRAIILLRTELETEVALLERTEKKRALTKEESKILKSAKKSFSETESYIQEYFSETTDSAT